MVTVNIGSLAETVFESEMFGHVRGAFTDAKIDRVGRFELADGGTLFLDEIANIPVAQQARLLRVLEDGEFERLGSSRTQQVDVRVLAATNADIDAEIAAGRFRADLLYRLNTIHIHLPPLRERGDDIVRLGAELPRTPRGSATANRRARSRNPRCRRCAVTPGPGTCRELSHVVERAVLMAPGDAIGPADLRLAGSTGGGNGAVGGQPMTLDAIEQEAIRAALARHGGNVIAAAEELGVSRSALYRRMEKLGL